MSDLGSNVYIFEDYRQQKLRTAALQNVISSLLESNFSFSHISIMKNCIRNNMLNKRAG